MPIIKCKMCGGDIELAADKTFGTCEYCGSTMTLPKVLDDQRAAAFNRGNHFRRMGEFDKALGVYERIVAEDDTDAEAHWCCALSRFGIEYVEDPATYEWLPTCHRASFDSFLEDVDYLAAVEHSDGITRRQYQKDAAKIAEVQRGILATSQNTEPYDVFISYKELDDNGERTRDSILAQEVYYRLTEKGWRVFFSRITLEDVPGTQYEPYIFAALNSAKVMIVVGTSAENLNAVWVKNEWSRFLSMMRKDRSKLLIPCYRDMDPYDLPEQLSVLMSYDMGKIGFIQDLIRGVDKVLSAEKKEHETVKETVVVQQGGGNANTAALLERAFMFLEDSDWHSADEYCERVLDQDPKNAKAYIGKLMAELHVNTMEQLSSLDAPFDGKNNYHKAIRFADDGLKETLTGYIKTINDRNERNRLDALYQVAVHQFNAARNEADYKKTAKLFEEIKEWRDSADMAEKCYDRAEDERKDAIYVRAATLMNSTAEQSIRQAAALFASIPGWKDADELAAKCPDLAEAARKNKRYNDAVAHVKRNTVASLMQAIEMMKALGDWRDAPQKVTEYEAQLEIAKKQVEEAAEEYRRRAEEERLKKEAEARAAAERAREEAEEAERQRILAEKAAAEKKAKQKKIGIIVCILAVSAMVIALLAKMVIVPAVNSRKAVNEYRDLFTTFKSTDGWNEVSAVRGYLLNTDASDSVFNEVLKDAEAGDSYAEYLAAYGYEYIEENHDLAFQWAQRSADHNNSFGVNFLGWCYANGRGVEKDADKSFELYLKAAKMGNCIAMDNLGHIYYDGNTVQQDYGEALEWFTKAANAGNTNSMGMLGMMYTNAVGVEADYEQAMIWFTKAAEAGDAQAMRNIGALYENGYGVQKNYATAFGWYKKAADAGDIEAMVYAGYDYERGLGVVQDYNAAMDWYQKAAEAGNAEAMMRIGALYFQGNGVATDYKESAVWFEKAAEAGSATAMDVLGKMYAEGVGVEKDAAKAQEWAEKAKAAGFEG